jgi:hypothetical protein
MVAQLAVRSMAAHRLHFSGAMFIELTERPVMPWAYVAIVLGEIGVLAWLATTFWPKPPLVYELGWAGALSLVAMQSYSLRRRVRLLRRLGSLRSWLDAHIFLGLQGFVFVGYHSLGVSAKLELAAINFALVALVVVTGFVGRYLLGLIARTGFGERWFVRWSLFHRPIAFLLFAVTTLHVLAHFAYAA